MLNPIQRGIGKMILVTKDLKSRLQKQFRDTMGTKPVENVRNICYGKHLKINEGVDQFHVAPDAKLGTIGAKVTGEKIGTQHKEVLNKKLEVSRQRALSLEKRLKRRMDLKDVERFLQ